MRPSFNTVTAQMATITALTCRAKIKINDDNQRTIAYKQYSPIVLLVDSAISILDRYYTLRNPMKTSYIRIICLAAILPMAIQAANKDIQKLAQQAGIPYLVLSNNA